MIELLPGVYQIETELGVSRLCLYLLYGERTLLVDSGIRDTPAVISSALGEVGLHQPIDLLLVSHADADHHGGNAAVSMRWPAVMIMCHELDRPRIESRDTHLRERYTAVVAADDLRYDPELMAWLADTIGSDTPVQIGLRGGETIRLEDGVSYEILHTPGHTAGHLALWDPARRVLIAQDAVLGRGVPDRRGTMQSPPPYYDVASYLATITRLQALEPEWLLTAHYPILRRAEAAEFLAASRAFVAQVESAVLEALRAARRPLPLSALIALVNDRLGPFELRIQWAGPVLAHLEQHVAVGRVRMQMAEGGRMWEAL
jgi:glyoxylase-like metal-dependent hydrolase (beta-lactamase superfamily II)